MVLKQQKELIFINNIGCLVDMNLLRDAVLWYANGKFIQSPKIIFMHGKYPGVNIYREKIHIHRLVMLYKLKSKIASSIVVHHQDGNKLNCLINNLHLDINGRHVSMHLVNKSFTEEHRRKIGEANRRRKGIKLKKKVNIDLDKLKVFISENKSINFMAKYFNCDWTTIKSRIYENPELVK